MSIADLPAVNATLNGLSACFLALGYYFVRRQRVIAHRNCMIVALCLSTLFLVSYVTYHLHAGRTVFPQNWFRPIYLTLLLTHTLLAVVIVPMVITTVVFAVRNRIESHKRLSRWTWPLWMYVSVTGVVIYLLLYQVFAER